MSELERKVDNLTSSVNDLVRILSKDYIGKGNLVTNRKDFKEKQQEKEDREKSSKEKNNTALIRLIEERQDYVYDKVVNALEASVDAYKDSINEMKKSTATYSLEYHDWKKKALEQSELISKLTSVTLQVERENKKLGSGEYFKSIREQAEQRKEKLDELELRHKTQIAQINADTSLNDAEKKNAKRLADDEFEIGKKAIVDELPTTEKLKGVLDGTLKDAGDKLLGGSSPLQDLITGAVGDVPGIGAIVVALKILEKISAAVNEGFEKAISLQGQYLSGINTRLNGLTDQAATYNAIMSDMRTFAGSQYVSMRKLTENVSRLTESGIAYNLEERALLETIKDRVVTTFSAVEGQLDRLILLQQSDLTRQQMGAEVELNRMFNALFKDTSYLSRMYDSVSSTLIDITASLNSQEAVETSFATHKWLGALYSSGMSDSAISSIAQGLVNLATGNIEQLNGTPLGNMFAMSANNAGLSYTDILSRGLNASDINALMQSMVNYLAQIAQDTADNNVARTAMFGAVGANFTYSDIRAINNLAGNSTLLNSIANNSQTYESTQSILNNELNNIAARTPVQLRVDTLFDNMLLDLGNRIIGENGTGMGDYIWYRINKMLPGVLGDLGSLAFSIGHIGDIAKTVGDIGSSLFQTPEESINSYITNSNYMLTNVRGQAYVPAVTGVSRASKGISFSSNITPNAVINAASASESADYNLYRQANATTFSASNRTGTAGAIRDVGDIYAELFEQQSKPVRVSIAKVEDDAKETGMRMTIARVEDGAKSDLGIGFNGMLVDVQNEDINSIINTVYTVRGSY